MEIMYIYGNKVIVIATVVFMVNKEMPVKRTYLCIAVTKPYKLPSLNPLNRRYP